MNLFQNTDTPGGINVRCDWVNRLRESGAENALDYIFGNTIGFIQSYWGWIVGGLVIAALMTLVFGKGHNQRVVRTLMAAILVALLLTALISLGTSIAPTVC